MSSPVLRSALSVISGKWHTDETCIKIRGRCMYLYHAIDSVGDTAEC